MKRDPLRPGDESVWDYPRPPRLEPVATVLRVVVGGVTVAETEHGHRVLETSHPPTYYIPKDDVRLDLLEATPGGSLCEWKGRAQYWTLTGPRRIERVAWSYPDPTPSFRAIADALAFYASKVDACHVGDARVHAQAGDFYGGWITETIKGPFKGAAGTWGW